MLPNLRLQLPRSALMCVHLVHIATEPRPVGVNATILYRDPPSLQTTVGEHAAKRSSKPQCHPKERRQKERNWGGFRNQRPHKKPPQALRDWQGLGACSMGLRGCDWMSLGRQRA